MPSLEIAKTLSRYVTFFSLTAPIETAEIDEWFAKKHECTLDNKCQEAQRTQEDLG